MKKLVILAITVMFLFVSLSYGLADNPPKKVDPKAKKACKATCKKACEATCKKACCTTTVYVTKAGKKYHKKNCKAVKGKKGIKLSEALKQKKTPCSVCKPVCFDTKAKKPPVKKAKK
ncbi:MAG: hypothetical protein GY757_45575 [bacterium]|nr:hypothetical protein [bacterium]